MGEAFVIENQSATARVGRMGLVVRIGWSLEASTRAQEIWAVSCLWNVLHPSREVNKGKHLVVKQQIIIQRFSDRKSRSQEIWTQKTDVTILSFDPVLNVLYKCVIENAGLLKHVIKNQVQRSTKPPTPTSECLFCIFQAWHIFCWPTLPAPFAPWVRQDGSIPAHSCFQALVDGRNGGYWEPAVLCRAAGMGFPADYA